MYYGNSPAFSLFPKGDLVNTMQGLFIVAALHFLARMFNVLAGALPGVAASQTKR
jgi:hypothetical protein